MSVKPQTPRRKAINTLSQGFGFAVAAALIMALYGAWTSASTWSELRSALVSYGFVQAIGTAGLTYLMREFVDKYRARFSSADQED